MLKNQVFAPVPILISLLFAGADAAAQDAAGAEHWYQIELIAFARTPTGEENTESWDEDPGMPSVADAHRLKGGGSGAYALLPASAFRLRKEYGGLRAAGRRITPLLHLAWRQPIVRGRAAESVYITTGYPDASAQGMGPPPALEGTVKVRLNRYLHVSLDLLTSRLLRGSYSPSTATSSDAASAGPDYGRFRMQAHRRMRSSELHYIDDPWLGVLIQITPYGTSTGSEAETPEAEPEPAPPVEESG